MNVFYALILGILQGLTEFLPISSSGHLILFENILGINGVNVFFNLILHFATLIAVVLVFWKDVIELIKHPFGKDMQSIISATIPTVFLALIVKKCFNEYFLVAFLGFGFLISSMMIFITSRMQKKVNVLNNKGVDNKKGFIIGLIQGFAVLPGISRSGSTICVSLLLGVEREKSAKYSFLISIPIIIGGLVLEIIECSQSTIFQIDALSCIVGFVSAFIVALFTIKLMLKIVKKGNWLYFAIYLFLIAVFVLLNQYWLCIF